MNPLKLNQSVLTLVGVCASNQHTTVINQIRNLFFYGLMVVMHLINIAACGLYVVKYVSSDYNGAIYGLLATTVLICSEYTLIVLRYHYKKLRTIFATLNAIYQECKYILNKIKECFLFVHICLVICLNFRWRNCIILKIIIHQSNRWDCVFFVYSFIYTWIFYYVRFY